ncbi:MAG: DUF3990 domain-containing protein [Clostridia bacterium]|nr:DUF3990 domain-containing protein [Clostridia bacterium]
MAVKGYISITCLYNVAIRYLTLIQIFKQHIGNRQQTIMNDNIILYHGSTSETLYHGSTSKTVKPDFNFDNPNNDYGRGFYCTKDLNLAKEWAVKENEDGYAYEYHLDMNGLKVLDLSEYKYSVLHWITLLVTNRELKGDVEEDSSGDVEEDSSGDGDKKLNQKIEWLKANFSLPIDDYDIIKGYRADDDYFSIAKEFLMKDMPVQALMRALKLGDWGEQIVLKSREAFSRIQFIDCSEAPYGKYYPKRLCRNAEALKKFKQIILEKHQEDDVILDDLVSGKVSKDDPRLYYKDDSQFMKNPQLKKNFWLKKDSWLKKGSRVKDDDSQFMAL